MDYDLLLLRLNAKWNWSLAFSWIPMTGDEKIPHTEIYQAAPFEEAIPQIAELLEALFNSRSVYDVAEDGNVQVRSLDDCSLYYDGLEHLYTNEEGEFMLYFSHEDSVTVGGEKLLAEIHKVWPAHKNNFWVDGPTYKLLMKHP